MEFKSDEIASVIREQISQYRSEIDVMRVGRVLEVGDGIAQIFGLDEAKVGEMLEFESGQVGQVFNLETNSIGAVIYGSVEQIKASSTVRGTGKLLEVPVGRELLGRVVNPLGRPLDGNGPIRTSETRKLEIPAPGIAARQPVNEPMLTGIKAIDSMMPIGRGQRELIIGDRKTGKTAIAIDAIINQKDTGVICVYVAIGQKDSTVVGVVETLRAHGALDHTIVVTASSSDPAPLQYIAPYSGCTIAEHFMYTQGAATLVVYDDLSKQAAAYRQISLLLRRPPGREAYPGDVFYLHSRLLERACKLADRYIIAPVDPTKATAGDNGEVYVGPLGLKQAKVDLQQMADAKSYEIQRVEASGGSMTALPICETQEGEVSSYIPTNLISITDGQIYLEPSLFFAGVRPAVNVGISVSRVGYKAAYPAMKQAAASLRLDMAAYRELESFAQLGVELDAASKQQLARGERMVRLLSQPQYKPIDILDQIIVIYAGSRGFFDDVPLEKIAEFQIELTDYIKSECPEFYPGLAEAKSFDLQSERQLSRIIERFKETGRPAAHPPAPTMAPLIGMDEE